MERIPEFIANHLFLVCLFVAILVMLLWNLFGAAMIGVVSVGHGEATRLINKEHGVVLDVRGADDFAAGHILGALHVPLEALEARRAELDQYRERPVIAVCAAGNDAGRVVRMLRGAGFTRAVALAGGIAAWQGAHLPVTRGQDNQETQ